MNNDSPDRSSLTPKQQAYLALREMQRKLERLEQARNEPIAVVGIGCRFPGGADSPDAYWDLLCNGVDAIREVPSDRWNVEQYVDPELSSPEAMNTRWGGFLDDIDLFDPGFFGISRGEASTMDPQQRIVLEVVWEALEGAALSREELKGTRTGVFLGISNMEYAMLSDHAPPRGATGLALSMAPNRVSYFFDFRGPSMGIDTACSSSLVATDLACESLRLRTSDLALAGGVNIILTPHLTVSFSQAGMMAPDGRCKTFDAAANGYVRSEGCGIIVLKRLSDALRDRHQIIGLIRGSAVNHGGRANGLTAPNGLAQQEVIRDAFRRAGLSPADAGYVETHGTGTHLGDVVEVDALATVIGNHRSPNQPCWIGSVKTNIGHVEAGAGIAGLIKILLAIQHEAIPPHLHFRQANPELGMEQTALRVATSGRDWARSERPRVASVSSFGVGGTNSHVVVGEAPIAESPPPAGVDRPCHLLTLSARTEHALKELARRFRDAVVNRPDQDVPDICYTANVGRTRFDCRLAVVGSTSSGLASALHAFGEALPHAGWIHRSNVPAEEVDSVSAAVSTYEAGDVSLEDAVQRCLARGASEAVQVLRSSGDPLTGCQAANNGSARLPVDRGSAVPEAWDAVLHALGQLHVFGASIDWVSFDQAYPRRRVVLPTYPFERKRCWYTPSQLRIFNPPFPDRRP